MPRPKKIYVLVNSGMYRKDGTDQTFTTKKEAQQVASALLSMRGWVHIEEREIDNA
jgi:hypothetical protein